MQSSRPEDLVDLDRYPVDRPGSEEYRALVGHLREELGSKGCAVIKGFVRGERLDELVAEADRVAPEAHRSFNRTNPYFTEDDQSKPLSHPIRRFHERSNAFVPADNFGPDSPLRGLYEWPPFAPFVQDALDEAAFYRYADPLADVIVNLVEPGGGFPWHFDTNNYTVTLALQSGVRGGLFEYCPFIRSATNENYGRVRALLDGNTAGVQSLDLEGGDLQIFRGRHTLHRVTAVEGERTRYVAIFSFAEMPGMVANPERCKQLYGRTLPVHRQRASILPDRLID